MEGRPEDDALAALGQEFVRFWRRTRAEMRHSAHEIDPRLELSSYQLMAILRNADAIPTSELLAELGLEKSTLSRQIAGLEKLGYVERMADPDDSRARLVALTREGRKLMEEQRARDITRWRARFADWERADIEKFTELMRRSASDEPHVN